MMIFDELLVSHFAKLLAAAAASANLRLVGTAPSPGAAPEGPPLQAGAFVSCILYHLMPYASYAMKVLIIFDSLDIVFFAN